MRISTSFWAKEMRGKINPSNFTCFALISSRTLVSPILTECIELLKDNELWYPEIRFESPRDWPDGKVTLSTDLSIQEDDEVRLSVRSSLCWRTRTVAALLVCTDVCKSRRFCKMLSIAAWCFSSRTRWSWDKNSTAPRAFRRETALPCCHTNTQHISLNVTGWRTKTQTQKQADSQTLLQAGNIKSEQLIFNLNLNFIYCN